MADLFANTSTVDTLDKIKQDIVERMQDLDDRIQTIVSQAEELMNRKTPLEEELAQLKAARNALEGSTKAHEHRQAITASRSQKPITPLSKEAEERQRLGRQRGTQILKERYERSKEEYCYKILDFIKENNFDEFWYGDLERIDGIPKTSISRLVKYMEERGWVEGTEDRQGPLGGAPRRYFRFARDPRVSS